MKEITLTVMFLPQVITTCVDAMLYGGWSGLHQDGNFFLSNVTVSLIAIVQKQLKFLCNLLRHHCLIPPSPSDLQ